MGKQSYIDKDMSEPQKKAVEKQRAELNIANTTQAIRKRALEGRNGQVPGTQIQGR